jgi:hypothetical protein
MHLANIDFGVDDAIDTLGVVLDGISFLDEFGLLRPHDYYRPDAEGDLAPPDLPTA